MLKRIIGLNDSHKLITFQEFLKNSDSDLEMFFLTESHIHITDFDIYGLLNIIKRYMGFKNLNVDDNLIFLGEVILSSSTYSRRGIPVIRDGNFVWKVALFLLAAKERIISENPEIEKDVEKAMNLSLLDKIVSFVKDEKITIDQYIWEKLNNDAVGVFTKRVQSLMGLIHLEIAKMNQKEIIVFSKNLYSAFMNSKIILTITDELNFNYKKSVLEMKNVSSEYMLIKNFILTYVDGQDKIKVENLWEKNFPKSTLITNEDQDNFIFFLQSFLCLRDISNIGRSSQYSSFEPYEKEKFPWHINIAIYLDYYFNQGDSIYSKVELFLKMFWVYHKTFLCVNSFSAKEIGEDQTDIFLERIGKETFLKSVINVFLMELIPSDSKSKMSIDLALPTPYRLFMTNLLYLANLNLISLSFFYKVAKRLEGIFLRHWLITATIPNNSFMVNIFNSFFNNVNNLLIKEKINLKLEDELLGTLTHEARLHVKDQVSITNKMTFYDDDSLIKYLYKFKFYEYDVMAEDRRINKGERTDHISRWASRALGIMIICSPRLASVSVVDYLKWFNIGESSNSIDHLLKRSKEEAYSCYISQSVTNNINYTRDQFYALHHELVDSLGNLFVVNVDINKEFNESTNDDCFTTKKKLILKKLYNNELVNDSLLWSYEEICSYENWDFNQIQKRTFGLLTKFIKEYLSVNSIQKHDK